MRSPLRIRGRQRVMRCAYCNTEKRWTEDFVNSMEALCLACWLRHHPKQIEPMRRALAEVDADTDSARTGDPDG